MTLTVNIAKQLEHFELRTDFSCPAGELTAIVGPSGAGKTTLVRTIAGLEQPDRGTISLGDTLWTDTNTDHCVPTHKRKIGLVFQDYTLSSHDGPSEHHFRRTESRHGRPPDANF